MSNKNNLLSAILFESQSYNRYDDIEKLVEKDMGLVNVPVQPLYVSLLTAPNDQIATLLPKFSPQQRQSMIDLDLWKKDEVDVFQFERWIQIYAMCKDDDITREFITSEDFLIYLKSRVAISTFDVEDPMYPDDDNYFLTDDQLLIVEFEKDYPYTKELKFLINLYYDHYGVETAYTNLFKMVNDSFMLLQETNYQDKRERLRSYGFVDYYDSLEMLAPFVTKSQINKWIKDKVANTAKIDSLAQNQSLHSSTLVNFNQNLEGVLSEISKVNSKERKSYLHFNFVRLINATVTKNDALRGGRVQLTRIGKYSRLCMDLGIAYVQSVRDFEQQALFDIFDFSDLYKVGHSLLEIQRKKIKKALNKTLFSDNEHQGFLGLWWSSFLDYALDEITKVKNFGAGSHPLEVDDLKTYGFFEKQVKCFVQIMPFVQTMFNSLLQLKESGTLNDHFYLNYEVENIDFESILVSSFINHCLGNFEKEDVNKMGLAIHEFKVFIQQFFEKSKEEYNLIALTDSKMETSIKKFVERFGMSEVADITVYLYGVLCEHLNGYEFDTLSDEDYKHVGGPILFASSSH